MTYFSQKTVWITGASSGIGQALAYEIAARGAHCVLTARSEKTLHDIVKEISSKGHSATALPGDVTDLTRMKAIASEIVQEHGTLDILIANAGTHVFTNPLKFDSSEYIDLMNLNFGGMLKCIDATLPHMQSQASGLIVGMASLAGFRGLPRAAAYGASKGAMSHFLESIRFHLQPENINVCIVNPGFVKTPLTDKNDFPMPFLTTAEKAAVTIADGIAHGKSEISFPIPFNWFMKFMRIIPYQLYSWCVNRLWNRMQ